MSYNLSGHLINDAANGAAYLGVKGGQLSTVAPLGSGWITLCVPNRHDNIYDVPIEIHVRRRTITNNREDLCVVFNLVKEWKRFALRIARESPSETYIPLCGCAESKPEQFVFVGISEIAQDAQQRGESCVGGVVRLRFLNSCPNWVAYSAKSLLGDGASETRARVSYGEHEPVFIAGRVRRSLVDSDGIDKMVESIPQVIERIGNYQRPSLSRGRLIDPQNQAVSGAISVSLLDETIRVPARPGADLVLDGLSVLLAPS